MDKARSLMSMLEKSLKQTIEAKKIIYYGYEENYKFSENVIYDDLCSYYFGDIPEVTLNMLENNHSNWDGRKMKSLEFITIHDTGASKPTSTAKANSGWCTNVNNSGSSWHYTIGNDGIYKQLDDDMVAWHAGDGANWAETTTLYNTGIKASEGKVQITLSKDGYFYLNDKKTNVKMPEEANEETGINDLGIICIKKDGYYHIPVTHVGKGYNNKVCSRGGNLNSIGIETAVNTGSNVFLTWHYTAKFVAELLLKYNLDTDRVVFHNNWSNKPCPQTMIRSNNLDKFLDMVETEYNVLKNYSEYKIKIDSKNPDVLDNNGLVVGEGPQEDTIVKYDIVIEKGNEFLKKTFECLVKKK